MLQVTENECPVCGCKYIVRTNRDGFKQMCRCTDGKLYDMSIQTFNDLFGDDNSESESEGK